MRELIQLSCVSMEVHGTHSAISMGMHAQLEDSSMAKHIEAQQQMGLKGDSCDGGVRSYQVLRQGSGHM